LPPWLIGSSTISVAGPNSSAGVAASALLPLLLLIASPSSDDCPFSELPSMIPSAEHRGPLAAQFPRCRPQGNLLVRVVGVLLGVGGHHRQRIGIGGRSVCLPLAGANQA